MTQQINKYSNCLGEIEPNEKKNEKNGKRFLKISKTLTLGSLFFIVGFFVSIAIMNTFAAWDTQVSPGEALTAAKWNDTVNKIAELNSREFQCAIVRRYENNATDISLTSFTGANPGAVNEIAEKSDGGVVNTYGFNCKEANGWIMTGCAHTQSGDNNDSDVYAKNNGCYAGDNDGNQNTNIIDMTCCRF